MSLASTAAPFDENNDYGNNNFNNETPVAVKRQTNSHNKTQKRIHNDDSEMKINPAKVNSVLDSIHKKYTDENNNSMGDFKPLAKPISIGTMRTEGKENMSNLSPSMNPSDIPQPTQDDNIDLKELNNSFMNDEQVEQYYKNLGQNYKPNKNNQSQYNQNYHEQSQTLNAGSQQMHTNFEQGSSQVLIDKLNYMINLLEEQQDERTNNVTEEVVLYSFLGVFIIFIVDSFARVGKYVR
jgi:hypothetical protein